MPLMSPEDRQYYRERACLERELAKSAPEELLAILHLELAARYEKMVSAEDARPKLRLIVNNRLNRHGQKKSGPVVG